MELEQPACKQDVNIGKCWRNWPNQETPALGCLIALVARLWKGNPYLGLVVGGTQAANALVAVLIGGVVPLLLKRMNVDPAVASGPILTTITNMCGFFLVLSFTAIMLPQLSAV